VIDLLFARSGVSQQLKDLFKDLLIDKIDESCDDLTVKANDPSFLDFSFGGLITSIPALLELHWPDPSVLISLQLSHCGLKEFPKVLLKFPNLAILDLSYNELNSFPAYDPLTMIVEYGILNLSGNRFQSFPTQLLGYPGLDELNLSHNQLRSFVHMNRGSDYLNLSYNPLVQLQLDRMARPDYQPISDIPDTLELRCTLLQEIRRDQIGDTRLLRLSSQQRWIELEPSKKPVSIERDD